MPLRKSPRRTRALLAANRRNSRKSTGPRTFEGKWHSSENAVRHYRRTQFASCIPIENRDGKAFEAFLFKLREAIMPADNAAGTEAVLLKAAEVWRVKRSFDRWIETRTKEDWFVLAPGAVPRPRSWRLKLRRPGLSAPDWVVTASVCIRWGRRRTKGSGQSGGQSGERSRWSATEDNEKDRLRMHTLVSVHSTGPRDVARASRPSPEFVHLQHGQDGHATWHGLPARAEPELERTKPESTTIQSNSENMSVPADCDPAYAEAYALAERIIGWLMGTVKRAKPECSRKKVAYQNMSPAGDRGGRSPNGSSGATSLVRVFRAMKTALVRRKEYSQMPPFQTKPECFRKEGPYRNMSKARGWLAKAASFLSAANTRRSRQLGHWAWRQYAGQNIRPSFPSPEPIARRSEAGEPATRSGHHQ